MPKKKCPACGSTETVKILYGMPSYEAFELVERGEIVLGGVVFRTTIQLDTVGNAVPLLLGRVIAEKVLELIA